MFKFLVDVLDTVHGISVWIQKNGVFAFSFGKLGTDLTVDGLNRIIRPLQGLFPSKNLNPKTIRQSVITNWLNEKNIQLEDVQLLSGQKWMSSTERYIKPNMDERREVINAYFPL